MERGLTEYITALEEAEKSGVEVDPRDFYKVTYGGKLVQSKELKYHPGHYSEEEVPICGELWVPVTEAGGELEYHARSLRDKIAKKCEKESK